MHRVVGYRGMDASQAEGCLCFAEPVTESKNLEVMRKFSEQYAKRCVEDKVLRCSEGVPPLRACSTHPKAPLTCTSVQLLLASSHPASPQRLRPSGDTEISKMCSVWSTGHPAAMYAHACVLACMSINSCPQAPAERPTT